MLYSARHFTLVCLLFCFACAIAITGCGGNSTTLSVNPAPSQNPGGNPGGNGGGSGSGGGTSPSSVEIAIVSDSSSHDVRGPGHITGYRIDSATGVLTQSYDLSTPVAMDIAVNHANNMLAVQTFQGVTTFAIAASTGTLTQMAHTDEAGEGVALPHGVVFHPSGKFLYALSNTVFGFTVDSNGNLTKIPGSPFGSDQGCIELAIDRTGNFIFALCRHGNFRYKIDQNTGALTNETEIIASMPTFNSTGHISFDIEDNGGGLNLESWSFDTNTGNMSRISVLPFDTQFTFKPIAVTRDDAFLYAGKGNQIFGFAISPSGTFTPIHDGKPFDLAPGTAVSGETVGFLKVDLSNRFLYASSARGISTFAIDHSTGNLTAVGPANMPPDPPGKIEFAQR